MSRRNTRTCEYCNEEFTPSYRKQEYCTLCEDFLDSFSVEVEDEDCEVDDEEAEDGELDQAAPDPEGLA